jgi:hypothetical protein
MIRLLTNGGYDELDKYVGEVFQSYKKQYLYYVTINKKEYVFYPDEVEVITEHVYFLEKEASRNQLASLGIVILITAIVIAIIFSVIF